jgi:hypothetical protein
LFLTLIRAEKFIRYAEVVGVMARHVSDAVPDHERINDHDPESTERRLPKIRLLHQHMSSTVLTTNAETDHMAKIWSVRTPRPH